MYTLYPLEIVKCSTYESTQLALPSPPSLHPHSLPPSLHPLQVVHPRTHCKEAGGGKEEDLSHSAQFAS